jgi:antitoxin ParD1/3/4
MNIEIPPELSPFVQQMISLGSYRNESEVLIEGLRLLKNREQLRAEVNAGIEQLEAGKGLDGDEVFARLEVRARQLDAGMTS